LQDHWNRNGSPRLPTSDFLSSLGGTGPRSTSIALPSRSTSFNSDLADSQASIRATTETLIDHTSPHPSDYSTHSAKHRAPRNSKSTTDGMNPKTVAYYNKQAHWKLIFVNAKDKVRNSLLLVNGFPSPLVLMQEANESLNEALSEYISKYHVEIEGE
jgi:hypothetical protein